MHRSSYLHITLFSYPIPVPAIPDIHSYQDIKNGEEHLFPIKFLIARNQFVTFIS